MSSESAEAEEPKPKSSRRAFLLGFPLALVGGGAGFYAAYSGRLAGFAGGQADESPSKDKQDDIAFLPIAPMIISLGQAGQTRHLRFQAQLEVPTAKLSRVEGILPRIVDVLNGYLRAVDVVLLEDPTALVRLRSQMLRRVQIIAGEGNVRDLLIMEFVLS